MRSLFGASLALLLSASLALAANAVLGVQDGGTGGTGGVSPTGSLTSTPATIVNPRDPQWAGGAKGDGVIFAYGGAIANGSTAFCAQNVTFAAGDAGKQLLLAGGASGAGGVLQATIVADASTHCVTLSAPATAETDNVQLVQSCAVLTPGVGYAPGDLFVAAGGTATTPATCKVTATTVLTAALVAGGSGGTNGTCSTLYVYGGYPAVGVPTQTNSRATLSGTISGGALISLTLVDGGSYRFNPLLDGETISGCGLTGATANLTMGAASAAVVNPGAYTATVATFTQSSTTGSGSGLTITPTFYPVGQAFVYGTNDGAALTSAAAAGGHVAPPPGVYLTDRPMLLPSNSHLECARNNVTLVALPSFAVGDWHSSIAGTPFVSNQNWGAAYNVDHDIDVTGCKFTYQWVPTSQVSGRGFSVLFSNLSKSRVEYNECDYGSDCVAFLSGQHYEVAHNRAYYMVNCGYDNWRSPIDGNIHDNYVLMSGTQGICYNSTGQYDTENGRDGKIIRNTVEIYAGDAIPHPAMIVLGALQGGEGPSAVSSTEVSGNTLDGGGLAPYGIVNRGGSLDNRICANKLRNAVGSPGGILDQFDALEGTPYRTIICQNSFEAWNTSGTNAARIYTQGQYTQVIGNMVDASIALIDFFVGGKLQAFRDNYSFSGLALQYSIAGTLYTIRDQNMAVPSTLTAGTGAAYSANSTDNKGTITVGAGPVTTITMAWRTARGYAPDCTFSSSVPGANPSGVATTTGVTITTQVDVGGGKVSYRCDD